MSMELHVFLSTPRLPDVSRWQAAIDALGFDQVKLHPASHINQQTSFVAATLGGSRGGFDFQVRPAREVISAFPGLRGMFPTRDLAATFRYGHDPVEVACALAALAGFLRTADAAWFDPADGICWDADAAVARAKQAMAVAQGK
jgi:hypothetical protein